MEEFALSFDRKKVLEQLIPGTEDYYYYTCLDHQHNKEFNKIPELLKLWAERHGNTTRYTEIKNRQALLTFQDNPKTCFSYIKNELSLSFNHQQVVEGKVTDYPVKLDQEMISIDSFIKNAEYRNSNLNGYTDSGLEYIKASGLNGTQRRLLLGRLTRPDYPDLVKLILDDLKYENSRGFGSINIHNLLLKEQLDELQKKKPELINQTHFVYASIRKLNPDPAINLDYDHKAKKEYLETLWGFVKKLIPAFNSLKVHVLYHLLDFHRHNGDYDKKLFLEYITLPKNASYVEPRYLKESSARGTTANVSTDFSGVTLLPVVLDDEPLVRDFLARDFSGAEDYNAYIKLIRDTYVKNVFAVTKILAGTGDMERWYSMLNNPSEYQALKDRVDIEFSICNKKYFKSDDAVTLDVFIKNVSNLVVKVFEINTLNYYLSKKAEIDTSIDLDGLIACDEYSYSFDEPPLRRVMRTFEFPNIHKRGVYIIEFIGNGMSSRALLRLGSLYYKERIGAAGHVFDIFDENNTLLRDSSIWMEGREYTADEKGQITIPYSTNPGNQHIIITSCGFAALDTFFHKGENYQFHAGFFVDREQLIKSNNARVLIRPSLTVNEVPVKLALIEDVTLNLKSTTIEGTESTKTIPNFELFSDKESTCEFQVPENLIHLAFTLTGKIQNISTGKKDELSASRSFTMNNIDKTNYVCDMHMSKSSSGYVFHLLGKNGEPRSNTPVHFSFTHPGFGNPIDATLQTDEHGKIRLGMLDEIIHMKAECELCIEHNWPLNIYNTGFKYRYSPAIQAEAGAPIIIPYIKNIQAAKSVNSKYQSKELSFSLLKKQQDTYVSNHLSNLTVHDDCMEITGLPPGYYTLFLKKRRETMNITIIDGKRDGTWVFGDTSVSEIKNPDLLQISDISTDRENITITLKNGTSKNTRVHLVGMRFFPPINLFDELNTLTADSLKRLTTPRALSNYISGRDIGDEYRYILERKYKKKFPGNMLTRPGLLLNPWAVRKTETSIDTAAGGEKYGKQEGGKKRSKESTPAMQPSVTADAGSHMNLDFLKSPSVVMYNLTPGNDGKVSVPVNEFKECSILAVAAVGFDQTVYREFLFNECTTDYKDIRLKLNLESSKHFTEQKQSSILFKGETLEIDNITTSKIEIYDSLQKVYNLYSTISKDSTLPLFSFILNWHRMKEEEKKKYYSDYACHELSFFIFSKDKAFFNSVILPYIKNKKHKTFLDYYLININLEPFLTPWLWGRLNIVEKILLCKKIDGQNESGIRFIHDLFEIQPVDIDYNNNLFYTAIAGSALDSGDELGIKNAMAIELEKAEMAMEPMEEEYDECEESGEDIDGLLLSSAEKTPPPSLKAFAPKMKRAKKMADERTSALGGSGGGFEGDAFFDEDMKKRDTIKQFYKKLDKTMELGENNYYKLTNQQQGPELVTINAFWKDFADHRSGSPFCSQNLAHATHNFTEMMFALSLLDLEFEPEKPKVKFQNAGMALTCSGTSLVFHKEIKPSHPAEAETPLLVSQNYFCENNRFIYSGNERRDNYVTDEFLIHTVYICQVILTNPTSSNQKLDLLLQIPKGAMPVNTGFYTRGVHIELSSYNTYTIEYSFYFPAPGNYPHYPVHVAKNERFIISAQPAELKAVRTLSKIDTTSWAWISQNGSETEVLDFLDTNNIERLSTEKIAWRMKSPGFYKKVISLLNSRHIYNDVLWSYGIYHADADTTREYLKHNDNFLRQCGSYLQSPLITIDPVLRKWYEHFEYAPLVNARAHKLGKERKILNDCFKEQYKLTMDILSCKPGLSDNDLLSVSYYLLLQERIDEAIVFFDKVDKEKVDEKLQYDYLRLYMCFYKTDVKTAKNIALNYKDYPVEKWRKLFANALQQIDEIDGAPMEVVDTEDRTQKQSKQASEEAAFEFKIVDSTIVLNYQNLKSCTLHLYLMDIELLFSRQPFVGQQGDQFGFIKSNFSKTIELENNKQQIEIDLPDDYKRANAVVEIEAGGMKKSLTNFSNQMLVQIVDNYGIIKVYHSETGKAIPNTYIKVYAKMTMGTTIFYKDGYTDLRGQFDYTSLNTNELDEAARFALLVLSDDYGAVIKEANPPKR
ncbi:MAG: hypothetical protein JXJ04_09280 [Spirochaetales bacterium]|nr:hypothetical protein [Spirochaetales bacterium]